MGRLAWRVVSALALLAATGCGDDGSGPDESIAVSVSPAALTLPQGGTGTVTATLLRGGGFVGPVTLTVEGLPPGASASVSPPQLTPRTITATVTVNVANTVPAATYTATIRASAAGVGAATTTYTLTVTAVANYALSATPNAVSVNQGGTGTSTIGIQRTNFTGPVTLTLDNPPAGITGTFNPSPATADQSALTINVGPAVTAGNYTLTVKGSATGPGDKTTTIALTVTPPPDYSLSTTPNTLSIAAGQSGQTTVSITRTNFTGAVTLSLEAPPPGVTAAFNPPAPTGNSSVATISVAATVSPGTYTITIKGAASGVPAMVVGDGIDEAAAAGDRTTTVALTVTPAASFTISASPNAVTVAPGSSGMSTVAIVRTNFTTDVALSLVNAPAGITGVFTPATLTGTTVSSSLAINVAATVAAGNYTLTVQGAGGTLTQTTTIAVTVAASSVSLSVTPTSLSIAQGSSGSATLNATRTNFTGNITLSVTGNPSGMTVTFNPNPITANTSTITVTVGSGVPVGPHTLTITGAAGAAGNPTTTLAVNVTAPTGGNITWEFCNTEDLPLKFWRHSGGTWAEVTPTVVGNVTRYSFSVSGTTGGIAFTVSNTGSSVKSLRTTHQETRLSQFIRQARERVQTARTRMRPQFAGLTSPFFDTFVMFALATELQSNAFVCTTTPAQVSKTFTVTGMGGSETGILGYGLGGAALSPGTSSYNLMVVPGVYDYLAAFGPQASFPDLNQVFTNYRSGRGEAAPGPTVAIDRAGAPAFVTMPFTVTGGASGSFYNFIMNMGGARGNIITLPLGSPVNQTGTGNLLFMQANDRLTTDMNYFAAINFEGAGGPVLSSRTTVRYFGSAPPASANFALPAAVPPFTVTQVMGAPVTTWTVSGQTPTDYQTATSIIEVSYVGAGDNTLYTVSTTRGWLTANNMSTSYSITGPTLPGFMSQWAPASPLIDAQVIMFASNFTSAPAAGSMASVGLRLVTPP